MSSIDYLLHESSVGYAIFKVTMQPDTVGNRLKEVKEKADDLAKFGKMVKVVSFAPFQGAQQALEDINSVSEGIVSDYLHTVLDSNIPKPSKSQPKITLGVSERTLASSIKATFPNIECQTGDTSEVVGDLLRGVRQHAQKMLKQLQDGDIQRAQLGLGFSYSRAKVKFNVHRNDNHIIQAIATLDHLDKAVNQFSMRVREWYAWHFPELTKIVSENYTYAKVALFVGDKKTITEDKLHELAAIVNDDESIARSVIEAAKASMGQDISEYDMDMATTFARRVVKLSEYRRSLAAYLVAKMGVVAPNLAALIGETVGARLISHAGSLTNLAKYPASTLQILGAEKALFRALKMKSNTPKYGLIYHSSFIGKAGMKNKGRISRFLANKCSIASRIDNFADQPSTRFGEMLRRQVEERLEFYSSGTTPTKNSIAMKDAMDSVLADLNVETEDGDVAMTGTAAPIVPPVDKAMEDVIPAPPSANPNLDEDEKARKLAKKEKKLMKEEKKKAKKRKRENGVDGEDIGEDKAQELKDEAERKEKKKEKKEKRKKHKHEKE